MDQRSPVGSGFDRLPLVIFLLAAGVRAAIAALAHFDGLYGQDAYEYLSYAHRMLGASLGSPPAGPLYYPLGYPALAALFMRLLGPAPLAAQLASLLTGAAVAPIAYLITKEVASRSALTMEHARSLGAAAAAVVAFSGQMLQSSISIMSDAPALFWASLAGCCLLRFDRPDRGVWLPLASAALALAIVTRWMYAGLLAPFILHAILAVRLRGLRLSAVPVLAAILVGIVIVAPQVRLSQDSAAPVLRHGLLAAWSPAHALRTEFDTGDGHFSYRLPPLLHYAKPFFHPFYLSPLLAPFVVLGAARLLRRREALVLCGWPLISYLFLIGLPYENARFGLALVPPVAILAALGLAVAPRATGARIAGARAVSISVPVAVAAAVALALVFSVPFTVRGLRSFLAIKQQETAAARYLESALPAGSTVLTFGLTATLRHYAPFRTIELYEQSPETLRPLLRRPEPVYVIVQVDNIESQWSERPLARTFRWLRDEARLQPIGRQGSWTLFAAAPDSNAGRRIPAAAR